MFKEYFLIIILGHILGDFYTQTQNLANKKDKEFKWVMIHGLFYLITLIGIILPIWSLKLLVIVIIVSISHILVDLCKYIYCRRLIKKLTLKVERNIFCIDQLVHIFCIIVISYCMAIYNIEINVISPVKNFFYVIEIDKIVLLTWIVAILLINKPANISIQKLLAVYKTKDGVNKEGNNVGRFIGTIERLIMLIFISIGQYSAIGLVLTAKSIARYDKISKEKDFAEYYLLGTLLSTITVVLVSFIIK